MDDTYTRCFPGMQVAVIAVQGVGPPTRISTSPTSDSDSFSVNVRPPSSERATCVPLACQATQTVPSDRPTATHGSVSFVWLLDETCSLKPRISQAEAMART